MTSHYWTAIDAADRMRSFWASPPFFSSQTSFHFFLSLFCFRFFISSFFCVCVCNDVWVKEWMRGFHSVLFFFQHFDEEENVWSPSTFCVLGLCWHLYRTWNLTRNDTIATVLSLFRFHCFHCGWQLRCFFCSTFVYHKDCFALTTMRLLMCSVSFSFIPPSNVFFPSFLFRRFFSSFWRLFCFFCLPLFLLFCRDDIIHWWYRWHPKHQMRNTVDHFDVFLDDASNRSQCQRIALVGRLAYFQRLCHFFSLNHFPIFFRRLHCKRT